MVPSVRRLLRSCLKNRLPSNPPAKNVEMRSCRLGIGRSTLVLVNLSEALLEALEDLWDGVFSNSLVRGGVGKEVRIPVDRELWLATSMTCAA